MDFSKEAILFLIYLQADRSKYVDNAKLQFFFSVLAHSALCTLQKKNVFENTHNTCMSKVRNTVGTKVSVCGT